MTKITLIVEGGCVQDVLSDTEDIQVQIMDYDNYPTAWKDKEKEFHDFIKERPFSIPLTLPEHLENVNKYP